MGTASGSLSSGTTDSFASSLARIDFLRGGDFASLGGVVDIAAPTVDSLSPSASSSILRTDALTFHVTDAGTLASITVSVAQGSDPAEVIHNGSVFVAPYSASSTRSSITNGYAYSVTRTGGWQRSSITLRIVAVDSAGNVTTETASFTVTNPPAGPVVDAFSPAADSSIARADTITLHVTDETSLASVVICAQQGSLPVETIYVEAVPKFTYWGSTRSSISGGYEYVLRRDNGWQDADLTIITKAVDGQGNVTTDSTSFTVTDPPGAPTFDSFDPADESSIAKTASVSFQVHDAMGLASVLIFATHSTGQTEAVYDGSAFLPPYETLSTIAEIDDGYEVTIARTGDWPASNVTLYTTAVNNRGAVATDAYMLAVTDAPAVDTGSPSISNVTPAPGQLTATTPLGFDVTDDSGLFRRVIVLILYSGKPAEVAYDGDAFLPYYVAGSSVASIEGGLHFSVKRAGGWPAAPRLKVIAIDRSGNEA